MKRFWNISVWTGGLLMMAILLAFSGNSRDEMHVEGMQINVDYSSGLYFVSKEEVEKILRTEYPYFDSLLCREININLLEERLDNHSSIRKAEVYSALDGILRIHISQKQPVFRVQNSGRAYYIDETGDSMALSPFYSAKVPLVTGQISSKTEAQIFDFFGHLEGDKYLNDFFSGLHVDENGDWVLFPKPGRHKVYVGQPTELTAKMEKLKTFYKEVVDLEGVDSIKALNLAYDKQVICTKY